MPLTASSRRSSGRRARIYGGVHLLTADVTGETGINFGIFLITGQHHLVRVHNNDKIATVNVGVKIVLFLPRKMLAASTATRPSTLSAASITYHLRSTSCGLAEKVFMVQFFVLVFRHPAVIFQFGGAFLMIIHVNVKYFFSFTDFFPSPSIELRFNCATSTFRTCPCKNMVYHSLARNCTRAFF